MKKLLVSVLVLALMLSGVVTILAACVDPIDYEHTIVFYSSQGDSLQTETANAIKRFEAKYPGWKVIHTKPGGYDDVRDKIMADFTGTMQPDVAYCYPDHVAMYLETGTVVNMSKYISSTETVTGKNVIVDEDGVRSGETDTPYTIGYTAEELADFVEGYYVEGYARNFEGYASYGFKADDMLTLPFVKSTELLYYNKTALDACNLQAATTWDELWAQGPVLAEKFPGCTLLGYDSEANWFITMCEQNGWGYTSLGSSHYLFNNTNTKDWLRDLNDKYESNYLTTQKDYGSYTSTLFAKGVANNAGGIVYCVGSSGGASHQDPGTKFNWGIAPIPGSVQSDGSVNYSAISQGPSLVMLSGGNQVTNIEEKEKMSFLFIKELLDPEFQAAFSIVSGYNPCRLSTFELPLYAKHMEGDKITAVAARVTASMVDRFFVSPAFVGSSTARDQVGTALYLAMCGTKSPEQALLDAIRNCGG